MEFDEGIRAVDEAVTEAVKLIKLVSAVTLTETETITVDEAVTIWRDYHSHRGSMSTDVETVPVDEAVKLIKADHTGANLDEARRFLRKAGEALKAEKFEEAVDLAKKSQLAVKPTTEYLLSKAKELVSSAEKSFGARGYEEALDLWKKALDEYVRAEDLAKERDESEIVEKMRVVEGTINDNISKANIAIDNREMLNLVEVGNNSLEEANRFFEDKKFGESNGAYEEARRKFREALELAEKRGFDADAGKIREALESIETSIEAALLSKIDAMLISAKENFEEKKFTEAERTFARAIEFLKGLEIQREELEEMLEVGRDGIIRAKLEQGREKMQTADQFFKDTKHYDAKEGYKTAREYLERVLEEASDYKLSKLVGELNNMIQACSQNIATATTALMDVGGVEPEIITVDAVGRGAADFRRTAPTHHVPVTPTAERLMEKYAGLEYLGGGGFADVYKGTKKDGSVVAVKVPRNLDESAEKVFFREISTWEKLSHRNIAKLLSPHFTPVPHIEVEYTDGGNLYDAMKTGEMDVERACRIAFDITRGLEYAHSKHVLHGDVNPKNILLTSTGEAKITDFGLAKVATSSSIVKGYTLAYASKEQVEKGRADEKTDVYQLGLTFYVMLTGSNPFDAGSRYDAEERVRLYSPGPPGNHNPGAEGLDEIIMRCLSKDPGERPSAREFRERIYEFVKKNYSESLHLTEDVDTMLTMTCNHAILAVKQGDMAECLNALRYALGKVGDQSARKELKDLIAEMEFRVRQPDVVTDTDALVDRMEMLLKKVEWGG